MFLKIETKWWVLMGMVCSFAMVFIDQTAIPVALPSMQKELNASSLMLGWIMNAYLLTLAALTIVGGRIGDLYGHRKAFLIGISLFIFSSILIGFAPTAFWTVIGRACQGIGGAFMVPAMTVIVTSQFAPEERGKAMGFLIGSAAVFAVLGPLFGGILTEYVTWRAVFWINIPFALISFYITLKMVPEKLHEKTNDVFDWAGMTTLLIGLFLLVFCIMEMPHYPWNSPLILGGLTTGLLFLGLFIKIELNHLQPLVDLSLFKIKQIAIPVYIFILIHAAFIASIFWAIFFQDILNVSAAKAGMMLVPYIIPVIILPTVGGRMRDKYGPKIPVIIGAAGGTAGMLWMAVFAPYMNYYLLLPALILSGTCGPFIFSAAMSTALQSVEIHKRGLVSGICNAARQIGSSIGLAVLGSFIIYLNKSHLAHALGAKPAPLHELPVSQLDGLLSGAARAVDTVNHLPPAAAAEVYQTAKASYVFAFSATMFIVALLCVLVLILAFQLPSKKDEIQKM